MAVVSWKPRSFFGESLPTHIDFLEIAHINLGSNERILLLLQYLQPGRSDCLWAAIRDRLETAKRRG
jgi:hypothetical protein